MQNPTIQWTCTRFEDLSVFTLYEILKLRQEIFIVEQECAYLDADGNDEAALHLLGTTDNQLCAYVRIFPPTEHKGAIIGRVIVHSSFRGKKLGYDLMKQAHRFIKETYPQNPYITLGAQSHLRHFYGNLGYVQSGPEYLEDNIPHIPMIRR